jgi:PKD repeat protein
MKKTTVLLAALFLLVGSVPVAFGEEIINQPPVAEIGGGDYFESVDQDTLNFYLGAVSDPDGDLLTYAWDFGDGATAEGPWVSHSYGTGTYTLTLTVSDGMLSAIDTATVNVLANTAPVADAGPDQSVYAGKVVTLDGSASYDAEGEIQLYQWDFGDGTGDLGSYPVVPHIYAVPGIYTVTLTAIDRHYTGATDTMIVEVMPLPAESVTITLATWDRSAKRLVVAAKSSREGAVLTVQGYGEMTYDSVEGYYRLVKNQVTSQPSTVTVTSSLGGSATAQVVRVK